ncbi:MAG: hypothetical protein RLY14_1557 [Planctomycetota bacterium]|jgi:hypothetical protein
MHDRLVAFARISLAIPAQVSGWLLVVFLTSFFHASSLIAQYSPEHPTVVQMVERGVSYLERTEAIASGEFKDGGAIIVGYTVYKVRGDDQHPLVKKGIETALHTASILGTQAQANEHKITYVACVSALLLCDVDPEKYRDQITRIRDWLVAVQKPHGGFSYLSTAAGDTSQVQYAMLAMWAMNEAGVTAPVDTVERALGWLRRFQNQDGGWGYQPSEMQAFTTTKSLATAGLGALMIGGDTLRLYGQRQKKRVDDLVPSALKLVVEKKKEQGPQGVTLSKDDLQPTIDRGVVWQNGNPATPSLQNRDWYTYWRYSQERYESFLEIIRNKQEKSPGWYNQGVEELRKLQDEAGAWGNKHYDHAPNQVATSFAVLFLIRSTQKAIGELSEGMLFGGYGLPKDTSSMRQVGDKVVGNSSASSIDDLLKMMEEDDPKASSEENLLDNLRLAPDPKTRRAQLARLSRILSSNDVLNSENYLKRRVAARLLSQADDLDFVPAMIYALGDPDRIVSKFADDGLRLVSRRLDNILPEDASEGQKKAAIEEWKKWYLSLRPDYIFLEP